MNYRIEDWDVASSGKVISLLGSRENIGTASLEFTGSSGIYTIVVAYFDDIDGTAILRLKVNDTIVDNWELGQNLDPAGGTPTAKSFTRRTIAGVTIHAGNTVSIEGQSNDSDWARVDFIQFIPTNIL